MIYDESSWYDYIAIGFAFDLAVWGRFRALPTLLFVDVDAFFALWLLVGFECSIGIEAFFDVVNFDLSFRLVPKRAVAFLQPMLLLYDMLGLNLEQISLGFDFGFSFAAKPTLLPILVAFVLLIAFKKFTIKKNGYN